MEYNLILNFKRSEILQTDIVFSQGDYGKAMLRLSCRDDDVPITGAQSATISFSTPNGYLVTGELVGGDGEYSYTFKGNELQAPGRITATVSLKWADGRLSSCMFSFKCRAVQGGTAIDSGNYLTEVDQVVQEAKAKIAELQKLIDQLKPGIGSTALTKADLQNDLTQEQSGIKALDALQGKVLEKMLNDLSDKMSNELKTYVSKKQIINNLLSTVPGNVLDAMQGKALGDRLSKTEQSITQLNSEFGTKSINLRDKLNQNIVNNDDYPSVCIAYKSGKVVTLVLFVNTKTLTGLEQILPPGALPAEYRPSRSLTFCLSGRNVGGWASATYVIGALRIATDGSSELATGTQKDNAKFIDSTFTYIAN